MENKKHISVVIPVYKAGDCLCELYKRLIASLEVITDDFEIILVEDCGGDKSWDIIEELAQKDARVIGIQFSRNFGQHYAITAGLELCKGDWVVVMDCDLQDSPDEIINLYNKTKEGYDIVLAQRLNRKDSFGKKMGSKLFYTIFSYLTDSKLDSSIGNFGIYNSMSIKAILSMKDCIRYFPTMIQWVGFKKCVLPIEHYDRANGKSSYSFKRLFQLAFNNIIAFSDKPLRLVVYLGCMISFISIIIAIFFFVRYFLGEIKVMGYASLILSIWFLGGVVIFILGIIGIYIGKTFDKVKERPIYIVKKKLNHE